MKIKKIRFIEPGNLPYRKSIKNLYVYDKYIRTPSIGLLTLTTIVKQYVDDTLMYSESISVTSKRCPPENINTIPNHSLLYRFHDMVGHNTIWPQVHASRGCPHSCDYCALIHIFGRKVRTRSPKSVIEDIRRTINFFDSKHHRFAKMLWITDDNFFADREWALSVLKSIIDAGIKYNFTIQARYEVGYDDEMLEMLKKAGFIEIAMGIEFLEDEAFDTYNKKVHMLILLLQ